MTEAERFNELKAENERLRMQLAACSTVALADTKDSAIEARKMHPDYRSAACDDVARRVDECIKLRERVRELEQHIQNHVELDRKPK